MLRQSQLKEIIAGKSIQRLINLCSVDACRIAFGYKIPIINFCDIPIIGYDNDIQKYTINLFCGNIIHSQMMLILMI